MEDQVELECPVPDPFKLSDRTLTILLGVLLYVKFKPEELQRLIDDLSQEHERRSIPSHCSECGEWVRDNHDCPNGPCIQCPNPTEGGYCRACDTDA
jgi:ribosomal protein L32